MVLGHRHGPDGDVLEQRNRHPCWQAVHSALVVAPVSQFTGHDKSGLVNPKTKLRSAGEPHSEYSVKGVFAPQFGCFLQQLARQCVEVHDLTSPQVSASA